MEYVVKDEKHCRAHEHQERHLHAGFVIDLGHDVGCGDVDGYAGGDRQRIITNLRSVDPREPDV